MSPALSRGNAMTSRSVWIVDWDIPQKPASARVAFYRALKKLRKDFGIANHMSSQSVMIVHSQAAAEAVHNLALRYGCSNIYLAIHYEGKCAQ